MKYLVLLLILVACGKDTHKETNTEKPVEVEVPVEVTQDFEGFYRLQNGGTIEFIADSEDKITVVSSGQVVVSQNPENGTFGEHPRISGAELLVIDKSLRWSVNVNYTSGQDIEEDISGSNITGTKKTNYYIYYENDKLVIEISIWQSKIGDNINSIIAHRVIKED